MKKTSLFTLILAFLAIGTTANASVMNKEKGKDGEKEKVDKPEKTVVLETWYFTGTDPLEPSHYSQPTTPPPCDAKVETICQILAPSNGSGPDMDAPITGKPGQTVGSQILDVQDELENPSGNPQPNDTVQAFRSK